MQQLLPRLPKATFSNIVRLQDFWKEGKGRNSRAVFALGSTLGEKTGYLHETKKAVLIANSANALLRTGK